jgi:hypothetical protein
MRKSRKGRRIVSTIKGAALYGTPGAFQPGALQSCPILVVADMIGVILNVSAMMPDARNNKRVIEFCDLRAAFYQIIGNNRECWLRKSGNHATQLWHAWLLSAPGHAGKQYRLLHYVRGDIFDAAVPEGKKHIRGWDAIGDGCLDMRVAFI